MRERATRLTRSDIRAPQELHLADGYTVDLCHIVGPDASWMAVQAYRDKETCEEMDLLFVPYPLITRVTVSVQHRNQHPAGFLASTPEA